MKINIAYCCNLNCENDFHNIITNFKDIDIELHISFFTVNFSSKFHFGVGLPCYMINEINDVHKNHNFDVIVIDKEILKNASYHLYNILSFAKNNDVKIIFNDIDENDSTYIGKMCSQLLNGYIQTNELNYIYSNYLYTLITVSKKLKEFEALNQKLTTENKRNLNTIKKLKLDLKNCETKCIELQASIFWRISSPIRTASKKFKRFLSKHYILLEFFVFIKGFLRGGMQEAKTSIIRLRKLHPKSKRYSNKISKSVRAQQSSYIFDKEIKFSVLVPLYNTPLTYLKEMIDSLQKQTYSNWELCLADGSDKEHDYVQKYCSDISEKDNRIIYKKLDKNKGISANTNECIQMSTGDYIALFDHDDVLHPSALFECMKAICNQNADYVYTDEAVFLDNNIKNIITYHFKPDFAQENLLANNYICHFSVFNAKLIDRVGMFRSEYDGSQDHDLILRLTKAANKVVHIPKILYFWRSHQNSVAMDINSKKYAINAGISAVEDFLKNAGIVATVQSSPAFPVMYKINYKIIGNPKISIIIQYDSNVDNLILCINSIITKSSYQNYEIIVVGNFNAENELLLSYNKTISESDKISLFKYNNSTAHYAAYNYAANNSSGYYLIFLHDDVEIFTDNWIEELLMYAQRNTIGAVGGKLLQRDDTIQHAGYILGLGEDNIADSSHSGVEKDNLGYMGKMYYSQNITAVSDACLMVKKVLFKQIGGFNEELNFMYGDIDFCLRLKENNFDNVFNPYCVLYHEHVEQHYGDELHNDIDVVKDNWSDVINRGDPYYNPNLSKKYSYYLE